MVSRLIFLIALFVPLAGLQGSRLVCLSNEEPLSFQPARIFESFSGEIAFNIFEGLVKVNSSCSGFEPALAKDWKMLEQGRRWRFFLRRDVSFHDGSVMNAGDVIDTFRQIRENGMVREPKRSILFANLSEILKVNDYQVEFVFTKPKRNLLEILSDVSYLIVARGTYRNKVPVGSGPYRIARYAPGERLCLKGFQQYWRGSPQIGDVDIIFFRNRKKMLMQFRAGKGDLIFAKSSDELLEFSPSLGYSIHDFPSLTTFFLTFNLSLPPFGNGDLRRAFSHLINYETVVKSGLQRFGENAFSLLTPEIPGYRRSFDKSYDLAGARSLLQRAGLGAGFSTEIYYNRNNPGTDNFVSALIRNGKRIGISITPRGVSFAELMEVIHDKRNAPVFISGFGKTVDPEIFLAAFESGGFFNNSSYSNREYDRTLEAIRNAGTGREKLELIAKAQEILATDCPLVPIYHSRLIYIVNSRVKRIMLNPIGVLDFFRCEMN